MELDRKVCLSAVASLQNNGKDFDSHVSMVISLIKAPSSVGLKPFQILLPHEPYMDYSHIKACVISRDPNVNIKNALVKAKIKNIAKVISASQLKKKYFSIEAKKELIKTFDIFLVDSRLGPIIPKLIGSTFYKNKKIPVPFNFRRYDTETNDETSILELRSSLRQVFCSTFFNLAHGPCISIKIGQIGQSSDNLLQNLQQILDFLDKNLPDGGTKNIKSIHLKTHDSVALPVFMGELSV